MCMKQVYREDHEITDLAHNNNNIISCNVCNFLYYTGQLPIEIDADDSDSDENILLPLPIPSNVL